MSSSGPGIASAFPTPQSPLGEPPGARGQSENRLRRARWWASVAGILAGLTAFGVGEAVYELIPAEQLKVVTMGTAHVGPTAATMMVAEARNGALTFGVLGLCVGALMGMAGGAARRSASALLLAGLLGSCLGLALCAGSSLVILPFFLDALPAHPEYDLILSLIMHASIWGLSGAIAGLAFAAGLGESRLIGRAAAAGFIGAVLGTVVFELVGAAAFPMDGTGRPVSTAWPSRLLARLTVPLATAAFVVVFLERAGKGTQRSRAVAGSTNWRGSGAHNLMIQVEMKRTARRPPFDELAGPLCYLSRGNAVDSAFTPQYARGAGYNPFRASCR